MKIVGIENSVYGKPMLIKKLEDGQMVFEPLPIGITRLEEKDSSTTTSTNNKLSDTTLINT